MALARAALLVGLLMTACRPQVAPGDTPTASVAVVPPAPGLPRVAYVWAGPPPSGVPLINVFRTALPEYGREEGKNVIVESVSVDNQVERYPQAIAELVASHPDVIVVGDSSAAPLVAQATTEIPIVLTLGGNVVVAGQACRVNRPCGNVTGLSLSFAPLSPKRLEMLTEVAPTLRRVGFLRNSGIPETEFELEAVQAAATMLRVEVAPLQFRTPADFEDVFREAIDNGIDALLVMPDGVSVLHRAAILRFTSEAGLPDAYGVDVVAREGGLLAYGADRLYNIRRAGYYVDQILRGAKPADLPIEQPTRFQLVINLARARQLGLTFPNHLLLEASEAVR